MLVLKKYLKHFPCSYCAKHVKKNEQFKTSSIMKKMKWWSFCPKTCITCNILHGYVIQYQKSVELSNPILKEVKYSQFTICFLVLDFHSVSIYLSINNLVCLILIWFCNIFYSDCLFKHTSVSKFFLHHLSNTNFGFFHSNPQKKTQDS